MGHLNVVSSMVKVGFATIIAFISLFCSADGVASRYKGLTGPPWPKGMVVNDLTLVNPRDANNAYTLSVATIDKKTMLLLSRQKKQGNGSKAIWEVRGTLNVTNIPDNYEIIIGNCLVDGIMREDVVAIAAIENKPFLEKIKKTWSVDFANEKLQYLPTKRVKCVNERFGF